MQSKKAKDKETKKVQGEIEKLSGDEKRHAEFLKEIEEVKEEIKSLEGRDQKLVEKQKESEQIERERSSVYQQLLNTYLQLKTHYEDVIKAFSEGKSQIMRDIDFRANVTFDREGFVEKGQDVLDNRRVDEERIDEYAGSLEELIASSSSISNESVERLIQEVSEFREVFKGQAK